MLTFSTQWTDNNYKIIIDGNKLIEENVKFFFRPWIDKPLHTDIIGEVKLETKKLYHNGHKIKSNLFEYSRLLSDNKITTTVDKSSFYRAGIRSAYKLLFPSSSVVGIDELCMAIYRTGIFEPMESLLSYDGWELLHASGFSIRENTYILIGKSKSGKSTITKMLKEKGYLNSFLGDNYLFVKDNKIRSIPEPLRGGIPNKFSKTYYGKAVYGFGDKFEANFEKVFIINRGAEENSAREINENEVVTYIDNVNNESKEGIRCLENEDPIYRKYNNLKKNSLFAAQLNIQEGAHNLEHIVKYLCEI